MERFKLIACEMHGFGAEEALGPAVSAWLVRLCKCMLPLSPRQRSLSCRFHNVPWSMTGFVVNWCATSIPQEAMAQRPAAQSAAADPTLLLDAYRQHKSLDFFDYSTYNATDLHPQNRS